jgi:hypothetical protein
MTPHYRTPYVPHQNCIAERIIGILCTIIHSLLTHASLPYLFWEDALLFATFIFNCTPSSHIPSSPYQAYLSSKPSFEHIHTFGCLCYAVTPKELRTQSKFQNPAVATIYLAQIHYIQHITYMSLKQNKSFHQEMHTSGMIFSLFTAPTHHTNIFPHTKH